RAFRQIDDRQAAMHEAERAARYGAAGIGATRLERARHCGKRRGIGRTAVEVEFTGNSAHEGLRLLFQTGWMIDRGTAIGRYEDRGRKHRAHLRGKGVPESVRVTDQADSRTRTRPSEGHNAARSRAPSQST